MINQNFEEKLISKSVSKLATKIFYHNLNKFLSKNDPFIRSAEITPLDKTDETYTEISLPETEKLLSEIKKVAVIKLNGGLGTTMGLNLPKSQLTVKNNMNFLEITCNQISKFRDKIKVQVPLIFMNSFNTDSETLNNLKKINFNNTDLPVSFIENKSPKISKNFSNQVKPANYPQNPDLEWAPPGHADIYPSLYESGLLDELISKGYEYLFISNVDNLGASLNLYIFEKFLNLNSDFVMEVAIRTENDKKGGHLALKNNKLILREVAQVSKEDELDFADYQKYKFFNTNSIWIKSAALKNLMDKNNGVLDLPLIINEKNINPLDSESEKIIQLETAMGSAISLFENAKTILVPSKRFIPVKNTNNLLYLLSDLVSMNSEFELSPLKSIKIDLNPEFYKNVADFFERFLVIPSLRNCTKFEVKSNRYFKNYEVFSGDVLL